MQPPAAVLRDRVGAERQAAAAAEQPQQRALGLDRVGSRGVMDGGHRLQRGGVVGAALQRQGALAGRARPLDRVQLEDRQALLPV